MNVCIYVRMHACMQMCSFAYVQVYVCQDVSMYARIHAPVGMYMYVCISIHHYMHLGKYVEM